jgi:hypothetical protein
MAPTARTKRGQRQPGPVRGWSPLDWDQGRMKAAPRFGLEDLPGGAAAASYAWAAPAGRPARPMLTLIVNLRIPRRCRSRGALIRSADVAMVVPLRRGWCTQKRCQGVTDPRGAVAGLPSAEASRMQGLHASGPECQGRLLAASPPRAGGRSSTMRISQQRRQAGLRGAGNQRAAVAARCRRKAPGHAAKERDRGRKAPVRHSRA